MTDHPCLEVPFDVVTKWEEIEGSCASLYAAAEWGYKKGLKEQRSIALRELADQVVPVWKTPPSGEYELEYGQWIAQNRIRRDLLALATELEQALAWLPGLRWLRVAADEEGLMVRLIAKSCVTSRRTGQRLA